MSLVAANLLHHNKISRMNCCYAIKKGGWTAKDNQVVQERERLYKKKHEQDLEGMPEKIE